MRTRTHRKTARPVPKRRKAAMPPAPPSLRSLPIGLTAYLTRRPSGWYLVIPLKSVADARALVLGRRRIPSPRRKGVRRAS